MGFLDRFKVKQKAPSDGYERMSAAGDNPDVWDSLSDEELKQVVMVKCVQYAASQDGGRIPGLLKLYRHAMTRLDTAERMELLTQFSAMTEERKGEGHMGLMMFLVADEDPAIRSRAAMSLAVLFDPQEGDVLAGPRFVVRSLLNHAKDAEHQGDALCGILLLGDKRLLPLLEDAWEKLSDDARLALSRAKSGFVNEGMVEFWLRCLENGCSKCVFGSIVAAIAKLPAIARVPFVLDVERVLPVYRDSENRMRLIRQISFGDYLKEIRPRLQALEALESEPKVIPNIYESWKNPDELEEVIEETGAASLFSAAQAALPNFAPIHVASDLLQQCEVSGLFAYGIFNPMGPTLSIISVLRHAAADTSLIHYQMLNPFVQQRMVIGALPKDAPKHELVTLLTRTFAVNNVDDSILIVGLPTFLILPEEDAHGAIALSCLRSHVIENDRLSEVVEELESLRRHEGRPWDRAASERPEAMMEYFGENRRGSRVSDTRARFDERRAVRLLEEWLQLLTSPSHLNAESRGFVQAWQGAIDLQAGNFLAAEAMSLEQMLNCVIESNPTFVLRLREAIQQLESPSNRAVSHREGSIDDLAAENTPLTNTENN
jgi:hypothetical protein